MPTSVNVAGGLVAADGSSGDFTAAELLRRRDDLTRCRSTDVADDVRFERAARPWRRLAAPQGAADCALRPGEAEVVAIEQCRQISDSRSLAGDLATRS